MPARIIPADSKAPGLTQALNTHDGAVMVMSYGNSEEESMEHTGPTAHCGLRSACG
ncbi:hypothetical protein LNP74_02745 [Klebsiella pneumoniae subsp. pneumoniae]|nr:hypothetical protein [Klebsiella pneumoniae subsp. pneumoniae]